MRECRTYVGTNSVKSRMIGFEMCLNRIMGLGAPPPMGPVRGFGSSNHNNARYMYIKCGWQELNRSFSTTGTVIWLYFVDEIYCGIICIVGGKVLIGLLIQVCAGIVSACLLAMMHYTVSFTFSHVLHTFRHSREKVNRTVFVEGIACDASVEDIAHFFAVCGVVVAVRVSDTCASSRRAWVEYETRDGAVAALEYTRPVRQHSWNAPISLHVVEVHRGHNYTLSEETSESVNSQVHEVDEQCRAIDFMLSREGWFCHAKCALFLVVREQLQWTDQWQPILSGWNQLRYYCKDCWEQAIGINPDDGAEVKIYKHYILKSWLMDSASCFSICFAVWGRWYLGCAAIKNCNMHKCSHKTSQHGWWYRSAEWFFPQNRHWYTWPQAAKGWGSFQ